MSQEHQIVHVTPRMVKVLYESYVKEPRVILFMDYLDKTLVLECYGRVEDKTVSYEVTLGEFLTWLKERERIRHEAQGVEPVLAPSYESQHAD